MDSGSTPADESHQHPFSTLEGHRYMSLTTFRKSGQPVSTPVWFAILDDRIHVFTDNESGKVRRIRNNPRVNLAPSDFRGRRRGGTVRATARIVDEAEFESADRALREKYGWQYKSFQAVLRVLGKSARWAFLELRPAADEDRAATPPR